MAWGKPPSALRATSPRGGRSWCFNSSPSGGSNGEAGVGGGGVALLRHAQHEEVDRKLLRVIARRIAPKQPRGMSISVRVSPLGCFAALAMARLSQFILILILSLSKDEDVTRTFYLNRSSAPCRM